MFRLYDTSRWKEQIREKAGCNKKYKGEILRNL